MKVLVIKHGGLADIVLAFQAFADIRAHYLGASVTLLTTAPFTFLRESPWFDEVLTDVRPPPWGVTGIAGLRRTLLGFDLVHDLEASVRTSLYRWLAGRPAWFGAGRGARLWDLDPARDVLHVAERDRAQLAAAGVLPGPVAALGWLTREARAATLTQEATLTQAATLTQKVPGPCAMLVPGAAPFRPGIRWPVERFGAVATLLQAQGVTPVIAGGAADGPLAAIIRAACPAALDLTGRATVPQVAALAAGAHAAVGNDTGLMAVAAAVGCPSVVLVAEESGPAVTLPRGPAVTVLRVRSLADLPVERVAAALR